jgi:hypothetical protein
MTPALRYVGRLVNAEKAVRVWLGYGAYSQCLGRIRVRISTYTARNPSRQVMFLPSS